MYNTKKETDISKKKEERIFGKRISKNQKGGTLGGYIHK